MTAIPLTLVGEVVIGDGHIDPSDKRDSSNTGQCLVRMSRSCFDAQVPTTPGLKRSTDWSDGGVDGKHVRDTCVLEWS